MIEQELQQMKNHTKKLFQKNGDICSIKPQILREKSKKFPRNLEVKK